MSEACAHARDLRARVPKLLEEGRLDRALRVMQVAEGTCEKEAPATWGMHVSTLVAIGRAAEALQLADRIDISDRASAADKQAAAEARKAAMAMGEVVASRGGKREDPELFDPAEKLRQRARDLFHGATSARDAGRMIEAKQLFLASWDAWHPAPRALLEAGLAAEALDDAPGAHRLWDRAFYDDSAMALRAEAPDEAPLPFAEAHLAWSESGAALAVASGYAVTVYDHRLGARFRFRESEHVRSVVFSADGGTLFAGRDDGKVRLYDLAVGAPRGELSGHREGVTGMVITPDGKHLVTSSEDATVKEWDLAKGRVEKSLPAPRGPASHLTRSADGKLVAWTTADHKLTVADLASGKEVASFAPRGGAIMALGFDPRNGGLVVALTGGDRLRYDLSEPKRSPITIRKEPELVALSSSPPRLLGLPASGGASPAGALGVAVVLAGGEVRIASAERDRSLRLTTLPLGDVPVPTRPASADDRVALLPPLARVASATDRVLASPAPLETLAVAPKAKAMAAGGLGVVEVWLSDPPRFLRFPAAGERAPAVALTPDARVLAMTSSEREITVLELATKKTLRTLSMDAAVTSLAFSADGASLAAGTEDSKVYFFGAPYGDGKVPVRMLKVDAGPVRSARFSPEGDRVLVAAREGVSLWDFKTFAPTRLPAFGGDARDADFAPDGETFAVASVRGALLIGHVGAGPKDKAPTDAVSLGHQLVSLAVTTGGLLATAEGDRVIGLRTPNGRSIQRFLAPAAVRQVAWVSSGTLAAACADGAVRLFRGPKAEAIATLRPALAPGASLAASVITTGTGHLEVVGGITDAAAARTALSCRLGDTLYPFAACSDQFHVPGLFTMVLAGKDPAEAEP